MPVGRSEQSRARRADLASAASVSSSGVVAWQQVQPTIAPDISADGVHVWQFPPDLPVSVRHFTFNRETEIRLNRHSYYEVLVGCSGVIVFQIHDRYFPLGPGDMLVIGSSPYHRPTRIKGSPAKAVALFFSPEIVRTQEATGDAEQYLAAFTSQERSFEHAIPAASGVASQVLPIIERIQEELPAATPAAQLFVRTCLRMILALLLKHFAAKTPVKSGFDRAQRSVERLRPLFDYMDRHYSEHISLSQAATIVHMSRSSFIRFFRRATAQTFTDYLCRFRIAKAQSLLATTDKSISEIGGDVGFGGQSHFGTVFRKTVNMTPLQYRRTMAGEQYHSSKGARQSGNRKSA